VFNIIFKMQLTVLGAAMGFCAGVEEMVTVASFGRQRVGTACAFKTRIVLDPSNINKLEQSV
jgi:4-hydroxy-3-methylbut-2-enyl diphosphate reductase IspH